MKSNLASMQIMARIKCKKQNIWIDGNENDGQRQELANNGMRCLNKKKNSHQDIEIYSKISWLSFDSIDWKCKKRLDTGNPPANFASEILVHRTNIQFDILASFQEYF